MEKFFCDQESIISLCICYVFFFMIHGLWGICCTVVENDVYLLDMAPQPVGEGYVPLKTLEWRTLHTSHSHSVADPPPPIDHNQILPLIMASCKVSCSAHECLRVRDRKRAIEHPVSGDPEESSITKQKCTKTQWLCMNPLIIWILQIIIKNYLLSRK